MMLRIIAITIFVSFGFIGCATTEESKPMRPRVVAPKSGGTAVSATALTPEQIEEIQTVITSGTQSLNQCYQKELERTKKRFSARVIIELTIGTMEKVTNVSFKLARPDSAEMKACMKKAIFEWDFPKTKGEFSSTYPFSFEPAY